MAPDLKQRYFIPYWTDDRLQQHLKMLKAFGFNAIQLTACGQVAHNSGVCQQIWKEKLIQLCRMAKELDMGIAQFVWGSFFYDAAKNVYVGDLDWHNAADRKRMEQFFENESFLAPWVDRVVTHWLDPGGPKQGCEQCSLATAIEIHNSIMTTFRRNNRKIRGSFSNWFMGNQGWQTQWRGYTGVLALAANPALDRQSGIALGRENHGMDGTKVPIYPQCGAYIQKSDLQAIRKAGRHAGIWSWYTTDIEIFPSLHVHADLLQNYFRAMAGQGGDLLDWVSVDDNCHGLNMQNLYIAGRLMQNPALDAQDMLDDFARGLVGTDHAGPVVQALRVIEQVRCRSLRYDILSALAPSLGRPVNPLTQELIERNLPRVKRAIVDLSPVSVDPAFKSIWPVTMSAAEYLEELKAHLDAIHQLLTFLSAAGTVEKMKQSSATKEKIETAISALPVVAINPRHTAGLEFLVYQKKLQQLRPV
jgi:hypothetical protein